MNVTAEEIYAIQPDECGWRKLPSGDYVSLGNVVRLGNGVSLGNSVRLGDYVRLGDGVSLGNSVRLGDYVRLGNGVRLGDGVRLGNGVSLGNDVSLGNGVSLGDDVSLGGYVSLGNGVSYEQTPPQVQLSPYMVCPPTLDTIAVGCVVKPTADWLATDEPPELADHPECQPWATYRAAIRLVADWQELQR